MTVLDDYAVGSGLTRKPLPRPLLPSLRAAEDFYLGTHAPPTRRVTIVTAGGEQDPLRPFYAYAERQLDQILALPDGWDGRRGVAISETAVETAVRVVASILDARSALPQFFPLPDGGVQVEWHLADNDIEIEVDGLGDAHVLAMDAEGRIVVEGSIGPADDACIETAAFLRLLSERLPH